MPTRPRPPRCATIPSMKTRSWLDRVSPHEFRTMSGRMAGGDDAGRDGVLPVVAHVGDAVGPAHHLAFGGRRSRARPRVVADPVECLLAQVQSGERDVGAPHGVVEPVGEEDPEGVLAGVTAGAVAAVVTERDGLGQGHVEAAGAGDRRWPPGPPRARG